MLGRASFKTPYLPAIEEVLPNGIERQKDRGEWVEKNGGHPDAKRGVLLSHQLSARNRVVIMTSQPFPQAEVKGAYQDGGNAEPQDVQAIALSMQKDKINGETLFHIAYNDS